MLSGPAFAAATSQLRLGMPLEPPNLDPTTGAAAAVDEVLYGNVMEGLVRIDAKGRVQPALATNWEVSPDGLIYIFHLRPGVRFHNGAPFDASVVKFTLDRARAPASANVQKEALDVIRSVDVLDPRTVRLTLSRPSSRLLSVLAWGDAVMVEPRSAGGIAARPVGTGPYRFSIWRRGDSVTLVRNDSYWGRKAAIPTVNFKFIADPTAAFAAMKAGDLDAFPDYPAPENLDQFKRDGRFRVVEGLTQGETILAINNRKGPLADVRVRRAIAHAIDRRAILQGAMFGHGVPIGSHYPPQAPGYVDLTGMYPHDPARARRLLAEAGYPNGFELSLKLPPPSYARRSGEIIAAELAQVGIRVRSQNLEWAQWLDQVLKNHEFDLTIVSHTEPMDFDIYARPDYYFGYRNAQFDQLLARLDASTDEREQMELLGAIQRKLAEDAVNVYLFQFPRLGVWRADLRGLWPSSPLQANDVTGAYYDGAASGGALATVSRAGSSRIAAYVALALGLALLVIAGRRAGAAYLFSRGGSLALTLVGATVVVFALIQVVPGDPASFMMGLNASPDAVAALRHQLGLDQPLAARYLQWIMGMLHGDFGASYTYRVPVAGLILERLAVSGPLALYAMLLSVMVGMPVGVLAAARRGGPADTGLMALSQVGVATPNFWLAMLLVMAFAMGLRWFSAGGFSGWDAGLGAGLKSLTLPAVALALPQAAIIARVLRSALIDAMGEDYVRTARAKGLSRGQALRRHALRNALIPLLSILGLQFPFLLAGSVIIENVFFLPGLGRLVFQAIVQRDLIVVQSVVMVLVAAVVLVTFLVDLGYALVDPRLRGRRAA
ncbi:MAG TPA: ABC transporter substrate-binding protein [Caulobacteraceae bacterium]|jgi:ABC-type dipeptide/oligopeptide/nickel transport system permease component/ABC-type transport system substrate-binding protein